MSGVAMVLVLVSLVSGAATLFVEWLVTRRQIRDGTARLQAWARFLEEEDRRNG